MSIIIVGVGQEDFKVENDDVHKCDFDEKFDNADFDEKVGNSDYNEKFTEHGRT